MNKKVIDLSLLAEVVPSAKELNEDEIKNQITGGHPCGCGWICSFTGDCDCTSGFTKCWGPQDGCMG